MMKSGHLILCGLLPAAPAAGPAGGGTDAQAAVTGTTRSITAGGRAYPAYVAAPPAAGKHPALVLLHSFNGLEPGYRTISDEIAGDGFVVIAPEWQTYGQQAGDDEVGAIVGSAVGFLRNRSDVDPRRLGLTGFCAGGRYTMLFLPQMKEFGAGVAWYGFPYSAGMANGTAPAAHIAELGSPMLMIHGSRDQASRITEIYTYTRELDAADRYFELKVYQGKPHGFMVRNGTLARDDAARDAYAQMISFFRRTLG